MEGLAVKFSSKYAFQAKAFFENYQGEVCISCPEKIPSGLKPRSQRKCRFCGKHSGEVTFRKDAHILPYGLGNRYLISDFECDACNEKFGRYENDLINYLGISRTISKTQGRKKVPGLVSKDLKATHFSFLGTDSAVKIEGNNQSAVFGFNPETNERTITYNKLPYIPINVFKSIYKMALCLVDESEVQDYESGLEFLLTETFDNIQGLMLFGYRLPAFYEQMFAELYRKYDVVHGVLTHTFILYYRDYMLQIFLPFNKKEFKSNVAINYFLMPPAFDGSGNPKFEHTYQIVADLSSNMPIKDDKEVLTLKINEDALVNTAAFDPVTKTFVHKKFDPNDIAKIIIVDKGFTLSEDDLRNMNTP